MEKEAEAECVGKTLGQSACAMGKQGPPLANAIFTYLPYILYSNLANNKMTLKHIYMLYISINPV